MLISVYIPKILSKKEQKRVRKIRIVERYDIYSKSLLNKPLWDVFEDKVDVVWELICVFREQIVSHVSPENGEEDEEEKDIKHLAKGLKEWNQRAFDVWVKLNQPNRTKKSEHPYFQELPVPKLYQIYYETTCNSNATKLSENSTYGS